MTIKIKDNKPQVGIFEIVDDVLLIDSEDVQTQWNEEYFDGTSPHLHSQSVKVAVKLYPSISKEIKNKFEENRNEYLNYPRGRVDYNTKTHKFHIMAARKFFTEENIEKITRAFHLPPYASGNIVLEADDGHYGY